ncbi:unnamed protein product [Symbiodinium microadriaticum]|nr:unnamed protein product [Symbiodinium microadriaticum]
MAPWSTPQLRTRLLELFGARMDPEEPRPVVMQTLLRHYERQGPRQIRHAQGRPLQPSIAAALTSCLRSLAWPLTTRERPTVQADKYFTLQRPQTKFTAEGGAKARLNAAKLERYAELWELVNDAIRSVDPQYADSFTGVAITKGFRDSPHIDTENVGPFYGLSLGNFCGGGGIAVESGPHEVTVLDTFERFGKVDGRYPHWVTKYTGERYSVICYRTTGEVSPMGPAVCPV